MRLGKRIKNYRKENNLTQQELAKKLFVSRSAIAKWEQERGLPSYEILEQFSLLLNVPLEELINQKEFQSITIENNHTLKRQTKYSRILFITLFALIITIAGILSCFIIKQKNKEEGLLHNVYCFAEIKEETLFINSYNTPPFVVRTSVSLNDDSVECYDKYGRQTLLSTIKNGYKLYVSLTYYQGKTKRIGDIKRINIIDDYYERDTFTKGFFISTSQYQGEQVPIYLPELDYNYPEYGYSLNNVIYPTFFQYPYFLLGDENKYYNEMLEDISNEVAHTSHITGYKVKTEHALSINVSEEVDTVFVYAIDNSQKGFREYARFTKTDFIHLQANSFEKNALGTSSRPYKIDVEIIIYVHFVNSASISVKEYDKNEHLVKTTVISSYEQVFNLNPFITQDSVRFVIVSKEKQTDKLLAVGETFDMEFPTKYGYMKSERIKLV